MSITITQAGTYTVVPGETYIISPSASGNINFVPQSGSGNADFTVEVNENLNNSVHINLNASSSGQTFNPTVTVGDGVNASSLSVHPNDSSNFGTLSYEVGENASIGDMHGANGDNSVSVGNGSDTGHILLGNGGPGVEQTVILGDNVTTGDISIGGSGTLSDPMKITLTAGDGTHIGGMAGSAGNIGLGGSDVDRTITFGDNVTVDGLLGMGGSNATNIVTIGDNYTQGGYFTGSTSASSTDTITIGNDWRFDSTFNLQGGNDSLTIGSTTRDSDGTMHGGDGNDTLTITVSPENEAAFASAATNAGWTQGSDGAWTANGRSLVWQGVTYSGFENANTVTCFVRGTLIHCEGGERRIEDLAVGDLVWTKDNGFQEIRWIGSRELSKRDLLNSENLTPIRISKGALGENTPQQDLLVSPQHRVLVRSRIAQSIFGTTEVLIAARQLLQIDGIDIAEDMREVEYFHILFDRHEVVLSNGAETESLFTGPEALKAIGKPALEEIYTLFPELRDPDYVPTGARVLASGRMGQKLVVRHDMSNSSLSSE